MQYCLVAVGIFQSTLVSYLKYVRMMVPTQVFHLFVFLEWKSSENRWCQKHL